MGASLDLRVEQKNKITADIMAAMKANDEVALAAAFADLSAFLQEGITQSANEIGVSAAADAAILASRGYRQLTMEETKYYDGLASAFKSSDPKMALTGAEKTMPVTIIESVLADIRKKHPLLDSIDLRNTFGAAKIIVNVGEADLAQWGAITDEIKKQISAALGDIDVSANKLTAYIPVPRAMLDLGAVWLDAFVRGILGEAIALGSEHAIIAGTGKNEPVGMIRKVGKAKVVTEAGYEAKTPIAVTSFAPDSYGELVAKLATNSETNADRDVDGIILVVNPKDYYNKVVPATTFLCANTGTYVRDVLPIDTKIIKSAALEEGKAVLGIGLRYIFAVGNGKDGRLEFDDSCQFIEGNRVYKDTLYGNGTPLDNNAFLYLDISGLEPAKVPVTTYVENDI